MKTFLTPITMVLFEMCWWSVTENISSSLHLFCYKNISYWLGPYSFSSLFSPSTFTQGTTCAYTCNTYSGWLYLPPTFTGYIPFDHFLARLYYICSLDYQLAPPMPFPPYQYSSYYILNPIPNYRFMTTSPFILTTIPVGDSVPCYLYHSVSLWLSLPSTLTLPPVSDSLLFPLTFLCTTNYSLVCAQFPYVYEPSVLQLYSSTWIYLVLHG
jgi:hypothetical protein